MRDLLIEKTISALKDDWERQGSLQSSQVLRLLARRDLSVEESLTVYSQLEALGIEVTPEELEDEEDTDSTEAPSLNYEPIEAPLLSAQQERDLSRVIFAGLDAVEAIKLDPSKQTPKMIELIENGKKARERFIVSNTRLVFSVARKYEHSSGLPFEDLAQEGMFGLMRAVDLFQISHGTRFSTYAVHWIRQSILRGIADRARLIRFPVHIIEKIHKVRRAIRFFARTHGGRDPTTRELAEELAWESDQAAFIRDLAFLDEVSLDSESDDGDGSPLTEIFSALSPSPDEQSMRNQMLSLLEESLDELRPRDRGILRLRFGFDGGREHTLEEIGEKFAVTRERIRQIQNKALDKLKKKAIQKGLTDYL